MKTTEAGLNHITDVYEDVNHSRFFREIAAINAATNKPLDLDETSLQRFPENHRFKVYDWCQTCYTTISKYQGFGPPHQSRCGSRYSHCTCDRCF